MGLSKKDVAMITKLVGQSAIWKDSKKTFGDKEFEEALTFTGKASGRNLRKVIDGYKKAQKSYIMTKKGVDGLKNTVNALRTGAKTFKTDVDALITTYNAAKMEDDRVAEGKSGKDFNQVKLNLVAALGNILKHESEKLSADLENIVSKLGEVDEVVEQIDTQIE